MLFKIAEFVLVMTIHSLNALIFMSDKRGFVVLFSGSVGLFFASSGEYLYLLFLKYFYETHNLSLLRERINIVCLQQRGKK